MPERALTLQQATAIRRVLGEVEAERVRQHARFGEQNLPDGTGGEASPSRTAEQVERLRKIRREHAQGERELCDALMKTGRLTWRHVLREEVFEAIAEDEDEALRAELIQVAAVSVQWIEAIDRRRPARAATTT